MPSARTLEQLAVEAALDLDEALVTLWDSGIDSINGPRDVVPPSQLRQVRAVLGLASKSQLSSVEYWQNRLDLSHEELSAALANHSLTLRPGVRTLPKGGVAAMRRVERHGDIIVHSTVRGLADVVPAQKPVPLLWRTVGKRRQLKFLDESEVLAIHAQLCEDFAETDNPIDTPGTRSHDLLASACMRPQTSIGSELKYPTVEMAAAALTHSIVNNHPFWNGNKRAALVSLLVFLDRHGLAVTPGDDDLFRFVLRVSQHRLVPRDWPERADRETLEMSDWIRANTRMVQKGERPLKWHKLRRLLTQYGCECDISKSVGNRINISRTVTRSGRFLRGSRTDSLHVQVAYGDEGREVDRNALAHLRAGLELDEDHGIDSAAFYEGDPLTAGDFILRYRRILRRLSVL